MKLKPFQPSGTFHRLIWAILVLALFFLIPSGGMLADSNAPTVTNTPEATNTPIPELPTQTPESAAAATNTPSLIIPTESDDRGAIAIATPPPGSAGGLTTLNRILLMLLGVTVVVVVGVIVYIFINQTRGGLGER